MLAQGQALATDPAVDRQLLEIAQDGRRAFANGSLAVARESLARLEGLNDQLAQEYRVRIVSRPGATTGFWRQPVLQPQVLNYYLVVEAVTFEGNVLGVLVENIETQKIERVNIWAQRVNKDTFDRIAAEKAANGKVVNDIFGRKTRGELNPVFDEPVPGGAITNWDD